MFRRLLKSGLILFAVFAVVWVATIAWWQAINRMPTTTDIVTHLFLLPAGMVAGYVIIKRALDGIRTNVAEAGRATAAATATGAGAATAGGEPSPQSDAPDATRAWRAALLASAVRAPAGNDAQALADAALASTQPDLVTLDGLNNPVFAAAMEDLDIEPLRETLATRAQDISWSDEALRALTMAAEVADELAMQAIVQFPPDIHADAAAHGDDDAMQLVVTALLPRGWPEAQQQAAEDWLRGHLSLSWPPARLTLETIAAKADGDALLLLDRATLALNRPAEARPTLRMLVAADSLVGASAVEQLEQHGMLFSATCQHGRTPGEAAAGVLLCAPAEVLAARQRQQQADGNADAAEAMPLPPAVTRVGVARLDVPTPDRGQPRLEPLGKAVGLAVESLAAGAATNTAKPDDAGKTSESGEDTGNDDPHAIAAVVTDTGVHPVRTVEVAQVFSTSFPKLDASADLVALGVPCGYAGAAGGLLPVVVAHHLARDTERPVLALTAADAQQRGAVAVLPALS